MLAFAEKAFRPIPVEIDLLLTFGLISNYATSDTFSSSSRSWND
jgi:hypothetical protein